MSRFRRVNSASVREGVAASIEAAGMTSSVTGLDISAWMAVGSPEVGRMCWSAMVESLGDYEAAIQKLAQSKEYGDWLDAHDRLWDGPAEDTVTEILHGAPDPERTVNVVAGVRAVCVHGKLGDALAAGVELAETATKITGRPMLFGGLRTGQYGGVVWLTGCETLADLERLEGALFADPSWVPLVDRHGPLFQPGADTTWFQRLG